MSRRNVLVAPAIVLGFWLATDAQPMIGGEPPARRIIVLTPEGNNQDVMVRAGDELVLQLPAQMPLWWAALGDLPGLRQVGDPTFVKEVKDAQPKALGRFKVQEIHYRVEAAPSGKAVEWMYCKLGKPVENGVKVTPGPLLKRDEMPTKRGTLFRVKLIAESPRPKS
ncbi:MAG: hypothetical protein JWN86_3424 [Planctomycetota bacterium]|nr:hypothetical protein [Planctomycetota bacterium]